MLGAGFFNIKFQLFAKKHLFKTFSSKSFIYLIFRDADIMREKQKKKAEAASAAEASGTKK